MFMFKYYSTVGGSVSMLCCGLLLLLIISWFVQLGKLAEKVSDDVFSLILFGKDNEFYCRLLNDLNLGFSKYGSFS